MKEVSSKKYTLQNREEPELYRSIFPYDRVPQTLLGEKAYPVNTPEKIWITDTTFRDGQQSQPPYRVKDIVNIYRLLGEFDNNTGLIRQSEFFLYSEKDIKAVEKCLSLGNKFPVITSWIRANPKDAHLPKKLEIKETGILTSVSDYHIYLKLRKDRQQAMEDYLSVVESILQEGIIARCHFEDITRADIYGFCLPFAEELMKLSEKCGIKIKIRLCDTLGMAVPYPNAELPRGIAAILSAFTQDLGFPSEDLEWHGHNDFHKALINSSTAWLYGSTSVNTSLFGIGERTGNAPLEAMAIEYLSLFDKNLPLDLSKITELAEYFQKHLNIHIPDNYPFAGKDFNVTRAGIHADGLLKNEEIYNIFNTQKLLDRPIKVAITDKTGVAGIAYWVNERYKLKETLDKRNPGIAQIYAEILQQYKKGRVTSISDEEMHAWIRKYLSNIIAED